MKTQIITWLIGSVALGNILYLSNYAVNTWQYWDIVVSVCIFAGVIYWRAKLIETKTED